MLTSSPKSQGGVFLLEALIAILIFSLGILAMLALQGTAITAQSDAVYRTEAANLANNLIGQINLNADRANNINNLANFSHQATGTCTATSCSFTGAASTDQVVTNFATAAQRLPGATASMQQILIGANNSVTITIAWRLNTNAPFRWHKVTAYIY